MKLSIFSLLILAGLVFFSCEKGGFPGKSETADLKGEGKEDYDDKEEKEACFELIYPVTYTLPDESTVTGNDEKEVWEAIKSWYESNPDAEGKPALQYPVEIKLKDGTIQQVNDEEAMITLKKDCYDKEACFTMGFPITYIMPDGAEVTGNDKETLELAMKSWYESNPDSKDKPALAYPVNIVFKDGSVQTIDNEAAMAAAKATCEDEG